MQEFLGFVILIYQGMVDQTMTLERLAALIVIATGAMGFGGWAVTSIITQVIRKEIGKLYRQLEHVKTRVTVIETKLGLKGMIYEGED